MVGIPILILLSLVLFNPFGLLDTLDSSDGVLSYPSAIRSKVYSPIYGRIVCTNQGLPNIIFEEANFVDIFNLIEKGVQVENAKKILKTIFKVDEL